jgi:hypothetical protein
MQWISRREPRQSPELEEGQIVAELDRLRHDLDDLKRALAEMDKALQGDSRFVSLLHDVSILGWSNLLPESVTKLQAQLQAKVAIMQLQSSEKISKQLKHASPRAQRNG